MKKIGNSFKGILAGIVMIIIGVVLLWWNEGNNVRNLKTTAEMEKTFIDVKSDSINPKNEGKLVATSGKLINDEELTDEKFDVTVKTPILKRTVEVYQWKEESETNENDDTVYKYEKEWSEDLIDSSEFHKSGHENPTQKLYDDKTFISENVKVGAFSLSSDQIKKLSTDGSFNDFNQEVIDELELKIDNKYITNTEDSENPHIGDVRITFTYNDSNEISVLAVQNGDSFSNFTSSAGKTINRVMDGKHTGKEMIEAIKSENKFLKWLLRIVGALLCMLGITAILGPISTVTSFIPIIGGIVGAAVGLVSFVLGLSLSLIVIAIAWIRFRPVVGISLLAIVVLLIVFLIIRGKKNKDNPQQPATE